jgi:hypothetical protein
MTLNITEDMPPQRSSTNFVYCPAIQPMPAQASFF